MKLRTRIALLAGAVIFLAALLGSGLSFRETWKSVMEEARSSGARESQREMPKGLPYSMRAVSATSWARS